MTDFDDFSSDLLKHQLALIKIERLRRDLAEVLELLREARASVASTYDRPDVRGQNVLLARIDAALVKDRP